jgi:hypothetical protein
MFAPALGGPVWGDIPLGGPVDGDITLCGVPVPLGGPDVIGDPGAGELGNGLMIAADGPTEGAGVRR